MSSKRLVHAAVICAVLATGATACGGNKKESAAAPASSASSASAPAASPTPSLDVATLSAEDISKQAHEAMATLTSFTVDGTLTSEGEKISLKVTADRQGNCTGTVGVPAMGQVELLRTGKQTYIKPDATFWKAIAGKEGNPKAGAVVAELFKGRYLTGGQDNADFREMAQMCDMVDGIAKDDSPDNKVAKGTAGTTNGVKTFSLAASDTDGSVSTLYIATEGKPYLIKMEQTTGSEPGQMNLSGFNKPVTVQAPPADNVIDWSLFQQKVKGV